MHSKTSKVFNVNTCYTYKRIPRYVNKYLVLDKTIDSHNLFDDLTIIKSQYVYYDIM